MTEGHHQQSPIVPAEVDMSLPVEVVMAISTYLRLQTGRWYLEVSLIGLTAWVVWRCFRTVARFVTLFPYISIFTFYFVAGSCYFAPRSKAAIGYSDVPWSTASAHSWHLMTMVMVFWMRIMTHDDDDDDHHHDADHFRLRMICWFAIFLPRWVWHQAALAWWRLVWGLQLRK